MRQASNSYKLSKAEDQLKQKEDEIGELKLQIDNLQAQMKAHHHEHHNMKLHVLDCKAEAVELSAKQQTMKGAHQKFVHLKAKSPKDQVVGANGDGKLGNLRSLFGLYSYGICPQNNLLEYFPMLFNLEWKQTMNGWIIGLHHLMACLSLVGKKLLEKVGGIMCSNDLEKIKLTVPHQVTQRRKEEMVKVPLLLKPRDRRFSRAICLAI